MVGGPAIHAIHGSAFLLIGTTCYYAMRLERIDRIGHEGVLSRVGMRRQARIGTASTDHIRSEEGLGIRLIEPILKARQQAIHLRHFVVNRSGDFTQNLAQPAASTIRIVEPFTTRDELDLWGPVVDDITCGARPAHAVRYVDRERSGTRTSGKAGSRRLYRLRLDPTDRVR